MADEDLQNLDDLEGLDEVEPVLEDDLPQTESEAQEIVDPNWGALVDTVDTTGDGHADLE